MITRLMLSEAFWHKGMWKESAEEREKGFLAVDDKVAADAVRRAFETGGGKAVAEWSLERAQARARKGGYVSPLQLASWCARLGRKQETLRFLEAAYREHAAPLVFLQKDPIFDFLHPDARYRALVNKMGLPPAY